MAPTISILIPYYDKMPNAKFLLDRCIKSIEEQTFKDYEIVITDKGKTSENVNNGIMMSKGEYIKIMCMDDYFTHKDALQGIIEALEGNIWLINGVSNNENPYYTGDIHKGNNKLGGLSAIAFTRDSNIYFDTTLEWLLDCDWYKKMYENYGEPIILNGNYVTIKTGEGQSTNRLTNEQKRKEIIKLTLKYV